MSRHKRNLILTITALTILSFTFFDLAEGKADSSDYRVLEVAQQLLPSARVRDAWKPVYQQLPDLPLENKYVSKETGKVDADSTLVDRLIRYHVYVKGRSPNYRLDWKLTIADYLGANEVIEEKGYPGANYLSQNPLEGDRAAVARLKRKQRDALVQSLVNVFNPTSSIPSADTQTLPQPSTTPSPAPKPSLSQPKPGDAELLK